MPAGPLEVGHIGRIEGSHFEVLQVLSPTELLATGKGIGTRYQSTDGSFQQGTVVAQPVEQSVTPLVMLRGIDPSRLKNPKSFPIDGVWHATGMETYETNAGTNTVIVLEPVDPALIKAWEPAYVQSLSASKAEPMRKGN